MRRLGESGGRGAARAGRTRPPHRRTDGGRGGLVAPLDRAFRPRRSARLLRRAAHGARRAQAEQAAGRGSGVAAGLDMFAGCGGGRRGGRTALRGARLPSWLGRVGAAAGAGERAAPASVDHAQERQRGRAVAAAGRRAFRRRPVGSPAGRRHRPRVRHRHSVHRLRRAAVAGQAAGQRGARPAFAVAAACGATAAQGGLPRRLRDAGGRRLPRRRRDPPA